MEFINYAHRGASAYAPENTMAAFRLGDEMGATGVETDVQKTRDGLLVLFHDSSLMRICGRPEAVHDLTYAQLLQLDFGRHMGKQFAGERIPTLKEFLQFFADKKTRLAIEIKEEGVEAQTLALKTGFVKDIFSHKFNLIVFVVIPLTQPNNSPDFGTVEEI